MLKLEKHNGWNQLDAGIGYFTMQQLKFITS